MQFLMCLLGKFLEALNGECGKAIAYSRLNHANENRIEWNVTHPRRKKTNDLSLMKRYFF